MGFNARQCILLCLDKAREQMKRSELEFDNNLRACSIIQRKWTPLTWSRDMDCG